jgi:hypothetical protein
MQNIEVLQVEAYKVTTKLSGTQGMVKKVA